MLSNVRLFPFSSFFFIFSFGICLAGASSRGNNNVLKPPLLPAQIHLAGRALLLHSGSAALSGSTGDQSVAASAWPALGSCCGRSPWGIQYPPASFHLPVPRQRGQGPCAISQPLSFPSAGPKRGPSSLPGLHSARQDLHTAGLRGDKSPHKPCNSTTVGEKNPEITELPATPGAG